MKKILPIVILASAFLVSFILFYRNRSADQKTQIYPSGFGESIGDARNWETKTDDQADVSVAVIPTNLSPQSAEWKFDISMDTHSVELDQDLTISSVLLDDQGREYKPVRWEGAVGGHHRKGILVFKNITPMPKEIKLKIAGVADTTRIFTWEIK